MHTQIPNTHDLCASLAGSMLSLREDPSESACKMTKITIPKHSGVYYRYRYDVNSLTKQVPNISMTE